MFIVIEIFIMIKNIYIFCVSFQDKVKLKVRKQNDPFEPEVVNNMVRYARKTIREFRASKHCKYILQLHLLVSMSNFTSTNGHRPLYQCSLST